MKANHQLQWPKMLEIPGTWLSAKESAGSGGSQSKTIPSQALDVEWEAIGFGVFWLPWVLL